MARESLSRALNKPHIAEFMRQKVIRSLAMASARAGAVKQELLDSDNAMVRDRASSFVLGLAGIQPVNSPSINVNLEIRAGYVIDISPGPGEVVGPERLADAGDFPRRIAKPRTATLPRGPAEPSPLVVNAASREQERPCSGDHFIPLAQFID